MSKPEINEPGKLALFLRALWDLIHRNWGYKLLALLLAVILWAGLITQDPNLTRQKVMTGGAIEVTGAINATRTRYGAYIVTAGLESLPEVTITADVPQLEYQNASAADYAPFIDLRSISGVGEQEIPISTRESEKTGTVTRLQPDTVTLTVDRYITRGGIAINPVTEGSLTRWYLDGLQTLRGDTISISGPETIVARVKYVEAVLDLNSLTDENGELREAYRGKVGTLFSDNWPIRLVCEDGAVYSTAELDALQISVNYANNGDSTVPLSYTILRRKSLTPAMDSVYTGTPAAGCAVVRAEVSPISVAGAQEALDAVSVFRLAEPVDISGCGETVRVSATAVVEGGDGLIWIGADGKPMESGSHRVDVTVVIQPMIPVTPALTGALPEGWQLDGEPVCEPDFVTVLNGAPGLARLEAVLDLSTLSPGGPGTFTAEVPFRFVDADGNEIPAASQMEVRSGDLVLNVIRVTYTVTASPMAEDAEEPAAEETAAETPAAEETAAPDPSMEAGG